MSEWHDRVGQLFLEASKRTPAEREPFLRAECGSDQSLYEEVVAMLGHDHTTASPLDVPILSRTMQDAVMAENPSPTDGGETIVIGGYRVIRVLGVGGMGVVYLAEQDRPRRTIALKVIKPGMTSSGLLKRFDVEQEALGRLQHSGIAQIFEAGVHKPDGTEDRRRWQPYFAMEFVEGLPLNDYCRTMSLGDRARLEIMARIADAVNHAHQRGVIHRDLKPGNILVDAMGQPKILDFGVARCTGSDIQATTLHTDIGQLVGTLPYMSPEQVAGDPSQIDTRSDIYALGVVMYQLLTGQMPHDVTGRSIPEAARIIIDTDPTPLSSYNRVFRGDLDTIVRKALEKDKARRYQSAAELAADIRRFLNDEPIVARPASTIYQWSKFAKRNKGLVAGLALAFAFLIVGLIGTSVLWSKALQEKKLAELAEADARTAAEEARAAEAKATRRFEDVRTLANAFIFDTYDQVTPLPGSTKVRKHIVTTALKYLDRLASEGEDDTNLLLDIAEAYTRIGEVQGYGSRSNLGDFDGAMASQTKAFDIRKALLVKEPENPRVRRSISISEAAIGNLYFGKDDGEKALEHFTNALNMRESLLAENPGDAKAHRDVATAHQWIGNARMTLKQTDEALASYEEFLRIQKELSETLGDFQSRRDYSVALEKIGDVNRDLGHELQETLPTGEVNRFYVQALPRYEESLRIRRLLAEEQPGNWETLSDIAISCQKVGDILVRMGRVADAMPTLQECVLISRKIAESDRDDVTAKTVLVVSLHKLSSAYDAMGGDTALPPSQRATAEEEAIRLSVEAVDILKALKEAGKLEGRFVEWIDLIGSVLKSQQDKLAKIQSETPRPATLPDGR